MDGLDFIEAQERAYAAGVEEGKRANGLATLLTGVVVGALGAGFWFWII